MQMTIPSSEAKIGTCDKNIHCELTRGETNLRSTRFEM